MDLIADGLLLAAALAAIFYCWAVNRRLGNLKQQSADLTSRLLHLDETVTEVRAAIAEGRTLAEQEQDRLGHLVKNADNLHRDLQRAAVTLEKSVSRSERVDTDDRPDPVKKPARQPKPTERESSLARVKRLNRRDVS